MKIYPLKTFPEWGDLVYLLAVLKISISKYIIEMFFTEIATVSVYKIKRNLITIINEFLPRKTTLITYFSSWEFSDH